jgi:hypothetical protein
MSGKDNISNGKISRYRGTEDTIATAGTLK